MKKIQISVGSVAQALDRFERVWQQAEKGTEPAAQLRLSFESLPTLLKNLTPAEQRERLARLSLGGAQGAKQPIRVEVPASAVWRVVAT